MPNLNLWLGIHVCWLSNDGELVLQSLGQSANSMFRIDL